MGIEVGFHHLQAVEAWTRWPRLRAGCARLLLELTDGPDEATTVRLADAMIAAVTASGATSPVLLHGEGTSCGPALRHAVRAGLDVRVGLEYTLVLPDGALTPGNAELVAAARAIVSAPGRAPA